MSLHKLIHNYKIVEFPDGNQGIRCGYFWHQFLDFSYSTRNRFTGLSDPDTRCSDLIKVNYRYQLLFKPEPKYKVVR